MTDTISTSKSLIVGGYLMKTSSILIALVCLWLSSPLKSDIEEPLWLIPTIYAMCTLTMSNRDMQSPGIITLKTIMFFRYALTPLTIYLQNNYLSHTYTYQFMNEAIYLMLYEMLAVVVTVKWTERKFMEDISHAKNVKIFEYNSNKLIFLIIATIIIFIIIKNPNFLQGFSLITTGESNLREEDIEDVSGITTTIWQAGVTWLYIYTCMECKKKGTRFEVVISISLAFLLVSFLGQSRISRWYTIMSFAGIAAMLVKLYPQKKRAITLGIAIPLTVVIVILSIYKNTNYLKEDEEMVDNMNELFGQSTMQSYFSGPVSVNNAIGMKEDEAIGLECLPYDLMNNMPIILHYIDRDKSTVNLYNHYIGRTRLATGGDLVIPLCGQSAIYFGYLLTPLLSIFCILIIRYTDKRYKIENNPLIFLYAFIAAWTAVCMMMLNLTVYSSWYYSRIIPLALLLTATENRLWKKVMKNESEKQNI